MNQQIEKLYHISKAKERFIIGLMSGTSLDGLDLAYCRVKGSGLETEVELLEFDTIAYDESIKKDIRKVFAKHEVDFPYLTLLNARVGTFHAELILQFMADKNIPKDRVDIIASHGQTVMHVPKHQHHYPDMPNATLQIGDGDHIAVKTGIITISDFRQKHVAAGGEGAPLAVYGDYLIFGKMGEDRIMLNMGGIANFTYLPANGDASQVFVTDTGPGNTMMDAYMKHHFDLPYDQDAQLSSQGTVDVSLLKALKEHYFFSLPFPKTTGPEVFNLDLLSQKIEPLPKPSHADVMATLAVFTAETIAESILRTIGNQPFRVLSSGGGAHNPKVMYHLKSLMPNCTFDDLSVTGIHGDAKEAVLFAVLANETLAGNPVNFGVRQGVPGICMGKISLPA
jgi:anhydro-N-acetylmuramic acid kinase